MDRTIISWNLMNWFTIVIMAALGYAALGGIAQVVKRNTASGGSVGG